LTGMLTVGVFTGMDDDETLKNVELYLIVDSIFDLGNTFNQNVR